MPRGRPFQPGQSGNPNGRPAGALATRTLQLREKARKLGCDPLEVMILEIRDLLRAASAIGNGGSELDDDEQIAKAAMARRAFRTQAVEVAAKLAPYLHPKLATIELVGDDDRPIRVSIDEARDRAVGALLGLAAALDTGTGGEDDIRQPDGGRSGNGRI